MSSHRYRQWVRAGAIYDLIVTAPFATPWSFSLVHTVLGTLSPLPAFEPLHVFFANLLGSIVVMWAVLRIRRPEPVLGLFDAFGRILFFTWMIYYLVGYHVTPVLWGFAAFEFFWGAVQLYGFRSLCQMQSAPPSQEKRPLPLSEDRPFRFEPKEDPLQEK